MLRRILLVVLLGTSMTFSGVSACSDPTGPCRGLGQPCFDDTGCCSDTCICAVTGPPGPHNPANADYFARLKALRSELRLSGAAADPERPDSVIVVEPAGLDVIGGAICQAFDVSLTELRSVRQRSGFGAARGAFVLLGREAGRQSLEAISKWIGYNSYAGASKAMRRLRAEIVRNPDVRDRVEAARLGAKLIGLDLEEASV